MLQDIRRIRTFLAYKGFQWDPIALFEEDQEGSSFIASRKNAPSFYGTVLSIGKEGPYDGRPIKVVLDNEEGAIRHTRLMGMLEAAVKPLDRAALDAGLPSVVAVVNHDPNYGFENLSGLLTDQSSDVSLSVDLFIWFDDFRSDRMLFRRTDPAVHETLFNWFYVAESL
jgi:hypothetical protein